MSLLKSEKILLEGAALGKESTCITLLFTNPCSLSWERSGLYIRTQDLLSIEESRHSERIDYLSWDHDDSWCCPIFWKSQGHNQGENGNRRHWNPPPRIGLPALCAWCRFLSRSLIKKFCCLTRKCQHRFKPCLLLHSLSIQELETLLIQLDKEFCHLQLSMHFSPQGKKNSKKTIEASKKLTLLPFPNLWIQKAFPLNAHIRIEHQNSQERKKKKQILALNLR